MASCCGTAPPISWRRILLAFFVTGQIGVVGLAINISPMDAGARSLVQVLLGVATALVFIIAGAPLARATRRAWRQRRVSFDLLFVLAASGALVHSIADAARGGDVYFEIAALLVSVHALGSRFNSRRRRLRSVVAEDDTPVLRVEKGSLVPAPIGTIRAGDIVRTDFGHRIAVDGRVIEGTGWVREAWWTGEPLPRHVRVGDHLLAGSHLVDGAVTMRVTAGRGARRLDDVLDEVHEALRKPPPLQRTADKLARVLLLVVVLTAAVTATVWGIAGGFDDAWRNATAVLLVACPCAMGFATPTAFSIGLQQLEKLGLATRSLDSLEHLARIDLAVFDKTGVLTDPIPAVDDVRVEPAYDMGIVLGWVHAVERELAHPIARAVAQATLPWRRAAIRASTPQSHESGVSATVGGRHVEITALGDTDRFGVRVDGKPALSFRLGERIRPEVGGLERRLQQRGIDMMVLTGDRTSRADRLPIPSAAALTPTDKLAIIQKARDAGRHILFVGDGLNDAAAMACAHVAIAPREAASMARDIAPIEWRNHRVNAIVDGIDVAREVVQSVRSNLLFAGIYNATGMTLAALGLLHPVWAALLMTASSFAVTLRASQFTSRKPTTLRATPMT